MTDRGQLMERRREPREILDQYYSVEIAVGGQAPHYQFKIRDISNSGLSVLVHESSGLISMLGVGDTVEIAYHTEHPPSYPKFKKAEIVYIEKGTENRFKNHYKVGMRALEYESSEDPSE